MLKFERISRCVPPYRRRECPKAESRSALRHGFSAYFRPFHVLTRMRRAPRAKPATVLENANCVGTGRGAAILVRILKKLPSRKRNALLRFYVDGEAKESVQAALDRKSVGHVKSVDL